MDDLFEKGADFQLTVKLYEERTGVALPKGKSYTLNNSALSRKAAKHGYKIVDIREEPTIVKTLYFKKK